MKVTIVCPPALTVTVAVPVARLLLTSNVALGKVKMPVTSVLPGTVSEITTVPAVTCIAGLHVPPGAGPAATDTGFPPTLKLNIVPTATPGPATLQT
ncbi:MAG: hypothetical protein WA172_11935 [Terriglobales bacterium]